MVLTAVDQSSEASALSAAVLLHSLWTCRPWADPRYSRWQFVHRPRAAPAGRLPECAVSGAVVAQTK